MIDIQKRVKFFQECKKMNNNQLAIASKLNPSVISSLFTRSQEPELSTLDAICSGLGVTMSEFFSEGEPYELTEEQNEILLLFNQLPEEKKDLAKNMLKALN